MIKSAIHSLSILHRHIPTNWLIRSTGRRVLLPFYHVVSDDRLPHIQHLYKERPVRQFSDDLDFFCRYYQPISMDELNRILHSGDKPPKPVFHLTFDDGLSPFYTTVAPILEARGIPATVFVNTSFIDNQRLFYRYKISLLLEKLEHGIDAPTQKNIEKLLGSSIAGDGGVKKLLALGYNDQLMVDAMADVLGVDFDRFLREHQPYLTSQQITELIGRGFTIGSHSQDHPWFKYLTFEEQKRQVSGSFKDLMRLAPVGQKYFSFPFSDEGVGKNLFDWFRQEAACSLSFGISGLKDDYSPTHLHRIPMEDSPLSGQSLIHAEYLYYMLKMLSNKNTIRRK